MQVPSSFNAACSVIIRKAGHEDPLTELHFQTPTRQLQLYEVTQAGDALIQQQQTVERRAGSQLQGFRAKLVDAHGNVVEENGLSIVLSHAGAKQVTDQCCST